MTHPPANKVLHLCKVHGDAQSEHGASAAPAHAALQRRDLLQMVGAGVIASVMPAGVLTLSVAPTRVRAASIELPPLPYALDALAPVISATTMGFHYGQHHKAYVANVNKAIAGTHLEGQPLDVIVREAAGGKDQALFNNSAQAWNHAFYWVSMRPTHDASPPPVLLRQAIEAGWKSVAEFRADFIKRASGIFGSGWLWLCWSRPLSRLQLIATSNADTPLVQAGTVPLAVIDVWEHAYYLDHQNRRAEYVEAWYDRLLDWPQVEARLLAAQGDAAHDPKPAAPGQQAKQ